MPKILQEKEEVDPADLKALFISKPVAPHDEHKFIFNQSSHADSNVLAA